MNEPDGGINLGPVYDGYTYGPTYDASPFPTGMIDEMGLPVAPSGNQDPPKPPKPLGLDSDEPKIIDRK
jgi:hypothetical protein